MEQVQAMNSGLVEWYSLFDLSGVYAAALIIAASFVYLGIYATRRPLAPVAGTTTLRGLGGVKLNGFEVVVGSILSVVLVVCVVLYGKLVEESGQIESAKLLGAWQIERGSDFQASESDIVEWLIKGEQEFDDEALLESRTEWAVSLADQHKITKRGFRIADGFIHAAFWFIMTATTLQILLISQDLHGLRVLMPAIFVGFMILMSFLASGASGLAPYLGSASIDIVPPGGSR
jgi:hypothetical protein